MAFTSNDGKKFSMASMKNMRNKTLKAKDKMGMDKKEPDSILTPPDMKDDKEPMEGASEVKEAHGPAVKVVINHNHDTGKHLVTSHHEDGHRHTSEHASAGEAHDEGRILAGADEEKKPEDEESGDEDYSNLPEIGDLGE